MSLGRTTDVTFEQAGERAKQTNPRRAVDVTWSAKARPEMR
jgi:hypothetical protein